jgi:colanic acid/amylovoran biosynthesis protein
MIIEIKGGGFINKGAQLMLQTLIAENNWFSDDCKFVMHMASGSFADRNSCQLGHLAWLHTWNYLPVAILTNTFFSCFSREIRKKYNICLKNEIEWVLDISGFIYSDQFGPNPCNRMADYYRQLRNNGAKIIIMPQAMGPFKNPEIKASVREILDIAELVFIRDEVSFGYVTELAGHSDKVALAPDFTLSLRGIEKDEFNNLKDRVCIIPNEKIFKFHTVDENKYIELLNSIISFCTKKKNTPFILLHENDKDNALIKSLVKEISHSLEIVSESDPLVLKAIIGQSKLVISSRYHGLINALYQSVPVIATGWSHKYEALLDEYNLGDYMISDYDHQSVINMLTTIFDSNKSFELIKSISMENKKRENKLNKMWQRIETAMQM